LSPAGPKSTARSRLPERERHHRRRAHVGIGFDDRRKVAPAPHLKILVLVAAEHEIDLRHLDNELLIVLKAEGVSARSPRRPCPSAA
jgi:hypothetical protein